ncbi:helix-turn-helix domain-containing protein [Amycolatopsis deserti]|uniref:helix-turn-helix domain-containing protein n=1 Tax=Amycolatopsis deserti TaxID=185696 RepID=UPI001E4AE823|nr:AraC family transcriptional regulator [Amycolatopsis deserti]
MLVRRGWFRRRTRDGVVEADPAVGYFSLPGDEEAFAHPGGGDVCTAVRFTPSLWASLFGERRPAASAVYVDAALELAHRRFIAATRQADVHYALVENLLALTQAAIGQAGTTTGRNIAALTQAALGPAGTTTDRDIAVLTQAALGPGGTTTDRDIAGRARVVIGPGQRRRGDRPTDRDVVARARVAIAEQHPAAGTLLSLAELLHISPFRLSRAFTREMGVPLTRYRNRVRVGLVMERLEAGETDLAGLAADLGFADQAHLTRTVKQHVGHPPTALRRLLRA